MGIAPPNTYAPTGVTMYRYASTYATTYSDENGARATHAHDTLEAATAHAKRLAALAGTITHRFGADALSGLTDDGRVWNVRVLQRCTTPHCGEYLPLGGITRVELDDETGTPVEVNYQTCGYCDPDTRDCYCPANQPCYADLTRVQSSSDARAYRAASFFDQAREARADAVENMRFGQLLDWHDGIAIYARDSVRTVIRERDNRIMRVTR